MKETQLMGQRRRHTHTQPLLWWLMAGLLSVWLAFASRPSWAHGGDDHAQPAGAIASGWLPRAQASSELFELVLVADGAHAWLYLTDFKTNAPITVAEVTLELAPTHAAGTAAQSLQAVAETMPGQYRVDWQTPAAGEYQATATIVTADTADVLTLTLPLVPPAAFEHQHSFAEFKTPLLWGLGVILVVVGGVLAWRRRGGRHA